MSGVLLLVPTPIAATSAADVLPQTTLQAVHRTRYFLAENAKSARAFLKLAGHPQPLRDLSISEIGHRPDPRRVDEWLAPLADGHDVAILSEAGCPAIADPGAIVVAAAHAAALPVRPLTGPSSLLLALMASGLQGQRFRFVGYVPVDAQQRCEAIRALERESRARDETQILIETPYRSAVLLKALAEQCADRTLITVAAALTGVEEFIRTQPASQWRRTTRDPTPWSGQPAVFCVLAQGSSTGPIKGRT